MSTKQNEKVTQVIFLVFAVLSLVFVMLDICNVWQYADLGWSITFGLYLAFEAKVNWDKNRKTAIINLVLAVALIAVKVLTMIL